MKKIALILVLLLCVVRAQAQTFPADGIGYQAMLTLTDKVTYGTTLKNVPVSNKNIIVRFELEQTSKTIFTDEHRVKTDINGIFSCIIGTGKVKPAGSKLTGINWGLDSVIVKVFVNSGDGEFLFSKQKLWSTAYAMYTPISGRALNDRDTSEINELQYLILKGDSVKLTAVSGGISLKPWTDGISNNAAAIKAEESRALAAESALTTDLTNTKNDLGKQGDLLKTVNDSILSHRVELNQMNSSIKTNTADIATNKSDISKNGQNINALTDSVAVHRAELNNNTSNILANKSSIISQSDSIAAHRSELNKNRSDINKNANNITLLQSATNKLSDSITVHRTELNKQRSDLNKSNATIASHTDSIKVHRTELNKNAANIAQHMMSDKDTVATNELTDLSYNTSSKELSLSNPKTTGNKVDLSGLQDNLGNHTATQNIKLSGKYLSNDGSDNGLFVDTKGRVGINTNNLDTALAIDMRKSGRAMGIPQISKVERDKISNPVDGSVIYNTTSKKAEVYVVGINEKQENKNSTLAYDGPIHGQTFQTIGGVLNEVNVNFAPRTSTPLAITCKLYENGPGNSPNFIASADSAITCYNPTGATFATLKSAVFTFNSSKPTLKASTTYYLEFSNSSNSTYWFAISNGNGCYVNDQITTGEYFSGSSLSAMSARTSGCYVRDLTGYILVSAPSGWEEMNKKFEFTEVDGSTSNELQDLSFNSTTKVLSITTPKTSGNSVDLSGLGGSDNLGNHTATQNIKLNGKFLSNDGGSEGVFVAVDGKTGVNTTSPEFSLHNKGDFFIENNNTVSGTSTYVHSNNGPMGIVLRSDAMSGVGTVAQIISRGQSSGNWPSQLEFLNQSSGYVNPVVNLRILSNGNLEAPNGTLKLGSVTYPKAHNSTANQVLTIDASGAATWKSPSGASSVKLDDLTDVIYGPGSPYGSGSSASLFMGSTPTLTSGNLDYNVAIGSGSYPNMISGSRFNTFVGNRVALAITSGNQNTFIGNYAGSITRTGAGNVFVGMGTGSGWMDTADSYNINIGGGSGRMPKGSNNVVIGTDQAYAYIYQGFNTTGDNQVLLGNSMTTSFKCKVSLSTFSDERIKNNIQEDVHGLDFILKLRPVTYNYKLHKDGVGPDAATAEKPNYENWDEVTKIKFSGFIAQEVEKAAKESGYEFSGVDKPKDAESLYALRYSEFVVPLVKSTQELNSKIIEQKNVIDAQQQIINDLMKRVEALERK
jgi:hypothetical protein